jgi:hypothetical protein
VEGKRKERKKEEYPKERRWGCQLRKMGRKKENKKRRHAVGLGEWRKMAKKHSLNAWFSSKILIQTQIK